MSLDKSKTVILIAGPTAVGKTHLAIKVAQHFHTSVISVDSRQCYREMSIGTAKPSDEDLKKVKHYFINSHTITEEVNAGIFEKLGLGYTKQIFSKNDIAVLCGGTGLYIKAFCEGLDEMPRIPDETRKYVQELYARHGITALQHELKLKDPDYLNIAEQQNPHRLMRALEVWEATGKSIKAFRKNKKKTRNFNILKIGLQLPKAQLWENIMHRTGQMIRLGLADEVEQLSSYRQFNALQTVGYAEMFDYIEGKYSLKEAIRNINLHTRQYAKRQMTWFRKDHEMNWFEGDDYENIMTFIRKETANFA